MPDTVDIAIEKLKARYLASTDQGLAKALGLSRSTVATWRNRGRVPDKFLEMTSNANARKFYGDTPWEYWDPLAKAGMQLALLRIARDAAPMLTNYETFLMEGDRLPMHLADYHGDACSELANIMADGGFDDPSKALQLKVYAEFFGSK